jgi:hypothetical protein
MVKFGPLRSSRALFSRLDKTVDWTRPRESDGLGCNYLKCACMSFEITGSAQIRVARLLEITFDAVPP